MESKPSHMTHCSFPISFARGFGNWKFSMAFNRFSTFFIRAYSTNLPIGLFVNIVIVGNTSLIAAANFMMYGMFAALRTNISRMWLIAKVYIFKSFKTLVDSYNRLAPLPHPFEPINHKESPCLKFYNFNFRESNA
mgnify:CR=1 FL=1